MLLIAHRGNVNGPKPELENSVSYLKTAVLRGFDVEIDLWVTGTALFFGHDFPQYRVDRETFEWFAPYAWFHCKNQPAMEYLLENYPDYKFFWHENDRYSLTSNGYIWTNLTRQTTEHSIIVSFSDPYQVVGKAYGVCADYLI